MPLWPRLLITRISIVVVSWALITLLLSLINLRLPAYVAAVMGGIVGVPEWEFLRRVQPKS